MIRVRSCWSRRCSAPRRPRLLALLAREPLPSLGRGDSRSSPSGAAGYGLSLRFYLLAQRAFGAARTGSVFAFAPFIGAALAVGLGDRSFSALMLLGSLLMLAGVVLHLAESHAHEHEHDCVRTRTRAPA